MSSTIKTITYKTVGELEIAFDVHLPANANNVPILLWFHGGGLLQGHRSKVPPHLQKSVSKYKHALISADYRLAPQVGVQDIYEDVRDSVAFIRDSNGLAEELGEGIVDTSRLAVSGSSAGGYLSLLAGLYVEPKPNVILPIYPITDPLGYFFTNQQPAPLLDAGKVDFEKKFADSTVAPFTDPNAEVAANNDDSSARNNMYGYMLDRANLPSLLRFKTKPASAFPYLDPENDRWRIAKAIKTRGLPPTYIVHGDIDRAVGVEQSDEVVGVMVGLGLEVKYDRLGVDHLWDSKDESVELEGLYEFMHSHL